LIAAPSASSRLALITTAARVPRAPSSATSPGALEAIGVTMIARSGAAGSAATEGKQGAPCTVVS
jgi:hypothetical protein